jgi:hypothetical protein
MKRIELRIAGTACIAAALCVPAAAFDFTLGDNGDIKGNWNTTLAARAAWRVQSRDPALYNPENGDRLGLPTGLGGNADDGELNYGKGDAFISGVRFVSDLTLKRGSAGGAVSLRGWYDLTQSRSAVPHGNEANNYIAGLPLSDRGAEPLARFGGAYLLNLYAFNTWQLDDGNSLYASVGRQVVNWGKGIFLQGVDQIHPLDVNALRRPGTQLKDALIPAAFLYVASWTSPAARRRSRAFISSSGSRPRSRPAAPTSRPSTTTSAPTPPAAAAPRPSLAGC